MIYMKKIFHSWNYPLLACVFLLANSISCKKSTDTTVGGSSAPAPTPSAVVVSTDTNSQLSTISTNPTTVWVNGSTGLYTTNSVVFTNTSTNQTITITSVIAPVIAPFSLGANTCQNAVAPGVSCTISYVLISSATTQSITQPLPQLVYTDNAGSHTTASLGNWFVNFEIFKFLYIVIGAGNHSCGIGMDHKLYCWGNNSYGQLGIDTTTNTLIPTLVPFMSKSTITSLVLGGGHTCAVSGSTELYCWGSNASGQLGIGNTTNQLIPTQVTFMSKSTITNLVLGGAHTCAVSGGNELYCWGYNNYGQLGIGNTTNQLIPTQVTFMSKSTITSLVLGDYHTCAVIGSTELYCWGSNVSGQLGIGNTTNQLIPTQVTFMSKSTITNLVLGGAHTCAVSGGTELYCWGYNNYGQLGIGNTTKQLLPTQVTFMSKSTITNLALGDYHTCAVSGSTELYCWGYNAFGQLGIGNTTNQLIPTQVTFMSKSTITNLALGGYHTCAFRDSSALYCWGDNQYGQLGVDDTIERLVPTQVLDPIF
jgi:alpha-tubulin suppressor-like RCC1 family protein